jgi:hypothetical protein
MCIYFVSSAKGGAVVGTSCEQGSEVGVADCWNAIRNGTMHGLRPEAMSVVCFIYLFARTTRGCLVILKIQNKNIISFGRVWIGEI